MQSTLWTPLLSELDDSESWEGGIDPLGLYAVADALGEKLAPGVRQRQSHPRFLTAITVSIYLCSEFDDDSIASDGLSEPWQVFEWYLVEGMVRSGSDYRGLPGSQKAERAFGNGVPLSSKLYLKSPAVFGFHGVYRVLARTLKLEEAGRLGESGQELLRTWEREQGLEGFAGIGNGPGKRFREQIADAVKDGLKAGHTTRSPSWSGWAFFSKHLGIRNARSKECKLLGRRLQEDSSGFRAELIQGLLSGAARTVWERERSEQRFHGVLRKTAGIELLQLLDAVAAYEGFARLCQDAFDDCLFEMTRRRKRTAPRDLATLKSVQIAAKRIPELFELLLVLLDPLGMSSRVRDGFHTLAERGDTSEWVERLVEHHCRIQKNKPPEGKNPWFERFDDSSVFIRPLYRRDSPGKNDGSYVHAYRTEALWSFITDLKLVKDVKA